MQLDALRRRRQPSSLGAWLHSLRWFDRRAIRDPDERDAYWVTVQRRLAESDAAFLTRHRPYPQAALSSQAASTTTDPTHPTSR